MKAQTVTLIGLNRTTISIGLALQASPLELVVVEYDADSARVQEAKELGAIDKSEIEFAAHQVCIRVDFRGRQPRSHLDGNVLTVTHSGERIG